MAKLYDKNGKEYNVPHQIDVEEWLKTGEYSLEKPEEKKTRVKKSEDNETES